MDKQDSQDDHKMNDSQKTPEKVSLIQVEVIFSDKRQMTWNGRCFFQRIMFYCSIIDGLQAWHL